MSEYVAGRDLDALIAERVFGWSGCRHENIRTIAGTLMECEDCGEQFGVTTLAMATNWPAYSTDIRAAWRVVDAMQERGWSVGLEVYWSGHVWAHVMDNVEQIAQATAHTAPLAICRAALAALEAA